MSQLGIRGLDQSWFKKKRWMIDSIVLVKNSDWPAIQSTWGKTRVKTHCFFYLSKSYHFDRLEKIRLTWLIRINPDWPYWSVTLALSRLEF